MKAQNKDKFNLKYNPNHKIKGILDIDPVITEKLPFTHIFASFVSTYSPASCTLVIIKSGVGRGLAKRTKKDRNKKYLIASTHFYNITNDKYVISQNYTIKNFLFFYYSIIQLFNYLIIQLFNYSIIQLFFFKPKKTSGWTWYGF